jgi:hypothetical protein
MCRQILGIYSTYQNKKIISYKRGSENDFFLQPGEFSDHFNTVSIGISLTNGRTCILYTVAQMVMIGGLCAPTGERFPHRCHPNNKIFAAIFRRLRETGTFKTLSVNWGSVSSGRTADDEGALGCVAENLSVSRRQKATELNLP